MQAQPIGLFDSGVGGTSILKDIHALLPHENIIYLADSRNAPYGNKSEEDIIALSVKNTELLRAKGSKIIVVACNTATTNAISFLRAHYNMPFIGIEPAIKPAALQTHTKVVGILATRGTLSSQLFHKTLDLYANNITVIEQIGEGIVSLIESGHLYSNDMKALLETYLRPMIKQNIDHLVLGCTHYPYLIPILKEMLPSHIKIIDSGAAVAKQTQTILQGANLLNTNDSPPNITLFTNQDETVLTSLMPSTFKITYEDY